MRKSPFEKLHTPARVTLASQIAQLALTEEKRSGRPTLYLTQYDIGKQLGGVASIAVSQSLQLAYTAEFFDEYGYGFVRLGPGRSGERYGYTLLHGATKAGTGGASANLDEFNFRQQHKLADSARQYLHLANVHLGTADGILYASFASMLGGAAAMVGNSIKRP